MVQGFLLRIALLPSRKSIAYSYFLAETGGSPSMGRIVKTKLGLFATNSALLKNCATDTQKYYDLTSSADIAAAFADITKKITNVRVSM